jgi:hypothetical protein
LVYYGGKGEIRTLGIVTYTTLFESVPFNHSGTFPCPNNS